MLTLMLYLYSLLPFVWLLAKVYHLSWSSRDSLRSIIVRSSEELVELFIKSTTIYLNLPFSNTKHHLLLVNQFNLSISNNPSEATLLISMECLSTISNNRTCSNNNNSLTCYNQASRFLSTSLISSHPWVINLWTSLIQRSKIKSTTLLRLQLKIDTCES